MPFYNNKKLLFFNEEGYPYNFEINNEGVYEGTVMFAENSSDLFKTLSIYAFEEVQPFSLTDYLSMNKMELYNISGISFQPYTYSGDTITNITRVNAASTFYSKWVYGENFDEKYPKGTVVSFSAVTFTTTNVDFNNKYYTVLDTKPDAILINTSTSNSGWSYTFSSGKILSHNIVSFNDYDNTIYPQISSWTLHDNKKFSIIGTQLNDGVNIYTDNQQMKTIYQTWSLSGNSGDMLRLDFELKTERPKLYQGPATFTVSGTTAYIEFGKKLNSLIGLEENQQVVFEDYDDNSVMNNAIFTIDDGTTEFDLYSGNVEFIKTLNTNKTFMTHFGNKGKSSQNFIKNTTPTNFNKYTSFFQTYYPSAFFTYDYFIQITGTSTNFDYSLQVGDTIQLLANSITTGSTRHKNDMREFTVLEIQSFYDIRVDYWKNRIVNDTNWYNMIVTKSKSNNITVQEQLESDAIWMYDNVDNNTSHAEYVPLTQRYEKFKVKEYTIPETIINSYSIKKLITIDEVKTIVCTMSIPSSYPQTFSKNVIAYDTSNILSFEQQILKNSNNSTDMVATIDAFNTTYGDYLLNNYGILVYPTLYTSAYTSAIIGSAIIGFTYLGIDTGTTLSSCTLNIHSVYSLNQDNSSLTYDKYFIPRVYINNTLLTTTAITNYEINKVVLEFDNQLYKENVYPNDYDNFNRDHYLEIYFDLSNNETNFGFNLELNDSDYYIAFTGNTQTTIQAFITKYSNLFATSGFIMTGGTNSLGIYATYPNVEIYSYKVKVNAYSSYEITTEVENRFIALSGNEIELINSSTTQSFYDICFSTGMIITVSDSNYTQNNSRYNIIGLTDSILELSYQGLFFNDVSNITIDVDRFLRKPRESANKNVYYSWKFDIPFSTDIFYYDLSGEHLKPYLNDSRLTYIGPKPLWDTENACSEVNKNIILRDEPNKKLGDISDPTKQQTVFRGKDGDYCLNFLLEQYDDLTEFDYTPTPLQVFLGYNSTDEGVSQTTVVMNKVENIIFSGYTNSTDDLNGIDFSFNSAGTLLITTSQQNFNFVDYGFEKYQPITIDFIDQSITGTTIFKNYGTLLIEMVGGKQMKFYEDYRDFEFTENNEFVSFSSTGNTSGYYYEIKVQPKPILKLNVLGETEVEDERFRIVLNNLGIQINEDVEKIFIESDIDEDGIDYKLLNRKRKEMLLQYPEIYNYIGSYKSVINAINYFGWNDLQLYEYYKNVNPNSPLYQKLHKVLIPDIFDNTVDGWTSTDYVSGKYNTGLFKKTNLFNLTYTITDEDGNNVLLYSLDEVQIKLSKLKRWLKRNVLPLSTNLIDITGVADVTCNNYQNYDVSNQIIKSYSENDSDVVNFTYTETLNFDHNYLFEIEFYTRSNISPSGWTCKIQTFSKDTNGKLIPQKYFKLMKNDLGNFSFNLDKFIDEYLYIETSSYNDYGVGQKYNKMVNTSTSKNYILVNNNFHIPDYNYLNVSSQYYWFDKDGFIYLDD